MTPPDRDRLRLLGLTVPEFARITGYSPDRVWRWGIDANPTPRWVVLLLSAWGASPEALQRAKENAEGVKITVDQCPRNAA